MCMLTFLFVGVFCYERAQRARGGSESSASGAIGPLMKRLAVRAVK